MKKITELTSEHIEQLAGVEGGATIWGFREATLLREVERYDEDLVHIIDDMEELERILDTKFDGAKQMPYFGAILTDSGKRLLQEEGKA